MEQLILKGVVAYVEVRSGSDNRSAAFIQELKKLGAQVEPTFTDDVTHVVFKEGMKRTWNKAVRRKVHLVSVSWIDSCKQNQTRVPEKDFPVVLPEEMSSPLPRFNPAVRWKKMKSMQPCDFDEDLARSAERNEKKRKRILMANRFKLNEEATPVSSPIAVLALDTQARSTPLLTALSRMNSPVPDTPPSMQERLERMIREQRQVLSSSYDDSPPATPKVPVDKHLQRRLLDVFVSDLVNTESSNDEDEATAKTVAKLIQGLDSNSECDSQPSADSKDKSPRESFPLVKNPGLQTATTMSVPAYDCRNTMVESCEKNKGANISLDKTEVLQAFKENSTCSNYSSNMNVDQSIPAVITGSSSKRRSSQSKENKRRSVHMEGNLRRKTRRMSSMSNALSPKDTNVTLSSSQIRSPELQHFESELKVKDLVDSNVSSKQELFIKERGPGNAKSAKLLKNKTIDELKNEADDIGTELKQRRSRRLSKGLVSSSIRSEMSSTSSLDPEHIHVYTNSCLVEIDRKRDDLASSVVEKSAAVLGNVSQIPVSNTSLKPKTTRKKKNLFTESVLPALCAKEASSKQKPLPGPPAPHRRQGQTLGSDIKSDMSFMFGASTPFDAKLKDKKIKNINKRQNTDPKNTPVTNESLLENSAENFLPKHTERKRDSLSKTGEDNSASSKDQPNGSSCGDSVLKSELSMSVAYGNDISLLNTRAGTSRRSLDEFRLSSRTNQKVRKLKEKSAPDLAAGQAIQSNEDGINPQKNDVKDTSKTTQGNKQRNRESTKRKRSISTNKTPLKKCKHRHTSYTTDTDTTQDELSPSFREDCTPVRLRHAQSLIMEQKFQPCSTRSAYSLVVTSLHRIEQETVYSVVKKLGVFHITNNVEPTSTHVVCGEPRRTLNVLKAIARGCWLLRKEWVLESLETGTWLREETYEMADFPAAVKSRTERQIIGPTYKVDLFSKLGSIFVSTICTPPRKELVHLITLCCGHVTASETRASIHLGDEHSPMKLVIKPSWVLDCIMKLETLSTDDYIVFPKMSSSQRETSPEF